MSSAQPGSVWGGRYRVERTLGQGGMGSVYAATDLQLQRLVALKVLLASAHGHADQVSRFALEARAIAALGHPNIATLFDFVSVPGTPPFLVMEHVDGESLRGLLHRERTLAPGRAARVAQQILSALAAAHAGGTIHRDIKPSNVMLLRGDHVKLVDFGVAKMAEGTARGHHTADGSIVGTPQYMPPEQAAGQPITPSVDLYAVGVCLFEMIAGYNPFAGASVAQVLLAVRNVVPPHLSQVRPDVPPALAHAVARALSKAPHERFASAGEFAGALGDAAPGPVSMHGAATSMQGPPSLAYGPPTFLHGPQSHAGTLPPAAAAPQRSSLWLGVVIGMLALGLIGALVAVGVLYMRTPAVVAVVAAPGSAAPSSPGSVAASSPAPSASTRAVVPARGKPGDAGAPRSVSGKADCICNPARNDEGTASMCRVLETPSCACENAAQHGNYLCPGPMDEQKGTCPSDPNLGTQRPIAGSHQGGACSGYTLERGKTVKVPGTYTCDLCAGEGRWFTGVEGGSCQGFNSASGHKYPGILQCGRR